MGRWIRKLFRWTMHGLAVLALLAAIASAVFWVRSREEYAGMNSRWGWFAAGSANSRYMLIANLSYRQPSAGFQAGSTPHPKYARSYVWSYWHFGRFYPDPSNKTSFEGQYDLFGLRSELDRGCYVLYVPFLYQIIASLIFAAWWFWRARRQWKRARAAGCCKKCGYNLRAHAVGQKCPECGTPIAA